MTPLALTALLHHYVTTEPFPRFSKPYAEAMASFIHHGILEKESADDGYKPTTKGMRFIDMILQTPMPVEEVRYLDPRTGEPITKP